MDARRTPMCGSQNSNSTFRCWTSLRQAADPPKNQKKQGNQQNSSSIQYKLTNDIKWHKLCTKKTNKMKTEIYENKNN